MERHYGTSQGKATNAKRSPVYRESLAEISMLTGSLALKFGRSGNEVESILNVKSDVEHSRKRRVLAHASSEKALRE